MKLNNEQNIAFMNNERRIEAQKKLDDLVRHIQCDLKLDGSAEYYLKVLPPILKRLEEAYENLIVTEATVQAELLGKV